MIITFDTAFDRGFWPGPLAGKDAVAGKIWSGPVSLLNIMETSTGLRGPCEPHALRIAALVPSIKSKTGFWTKPAEVDPKHR